MFVKELKELLENVPDNAELVLETGSEISIHTNKFDRLGYEDYNETSIESGEICSVDFNNDKNFPEVIFKIRATLKS